MDAAIVLAAIAGLCWAANIVVVRWALGRADVEPLAGALVGVGVAAIVAAAIAIVSGQALPASEDVWRYALVGAIAPGTSQGLFVAAIGSIGPSRASVLVGTSPIFSVLLAILLLDEQWRIAIVVGTLLTVIGGALIGWEPHMSARRIGVLLAVLTAVSFGIRDVVARHFNTGSDVGSWWSGAVTLGSAAVVLAVMASVKQRRNLFRSVGVALPDFLASGLLIGLALPTLLAALDRGVVGVVVPLSLAAQNVSVVILGAIVFGAQERTPRILLALVLIVGGGALVVAA
jgi:drug/metabolite transporter (DMT)-like permease